MVAGCAQRKKKQRSGRNLTCASLLAGDTHICTSALPHAEREGKRSQEPSSSTRDLSLSLSLSLSPSLTLSLSLRTFEGARLAQLLQPLPRVSLSLLNALVLINTLYIFIIYTFIIHFVICVCVSHSLPSVCVSLSPLPIFLTLSLSLSGRCRGLMRQD